MRELPPCEDRGRSIKVRSGPVVNVNVRGGRAVFGVERWKATILRRAFIAAPRSKIRARQEASASGVSSPGRSVPESFAGGLAEKVCARERGPVEASPKTEQVNCVTKLFPRLRVLRSAKLQSSFLLQLVTASRM